MDGTSSDSEGIPSEELSQDSLEVDHTRCCCSSVFLSGVEQNTLNFTTSEILEKIDM